MSWNFKAQTDKVISFEEFLSISARSNLTDPGCAMIDVLMDHPVPGIDVNRIVRDGYLDPRYKPGNILKFLHHIAQEGAWGVNINVRVS